MPHYARTYGTTLQGKDRDYAWQYPTGPLLDSFGIPINKKTFGLEEFNFNPFYLKHKVAYVPCYGTERFYHRPIIKELRLIYKIAPRCYKHYATLYNIESFEDNDIPNLKGLIEPHLNEIYFRQAYQAFFGLDFPLFQQAITNSLGSNIIASNHNNSSFVVNLKYEKIEILKKPIKCGLNAHFAGQWYGRVEYPVITEMLYTK